MFFTAYDRKSPRHNWQILVRTDNKTHLDNCLGVWASRAKATPGWEKYQQGIIVDHTELYPDHPSTWPRGTKLQDPWKLTR